MPKGSDYQYIKAYSINDAIDALHQYGPQAVLFAGGTDLLIQIRQQAVEPLCLIDVKGILELREITHDGNFVKIGAATTLREVQKSSVVDSVFPVLAETARHVGSIQLRNRATVGGNLCQSVKCPYYNQSHINSFMRQAIKPCFKRGGKLCHTARWGSEVSHSIITGSNYCRASFGSNIAVTLAALQGLVVLVNRDGSREVSIDRFYMENGEPDIACHEIITHIKIPLSNRNTGVFLQYKANPASYTLLNIAVSLTLEDDEKTCKTSRVWLGGVAAQPYECDTVQQYLRGRRLTEELIAKVSGSLFEHIVVSEPPLTFKVARVRVLCREALLKAIGKA